MNLRNTLLTLSLLALANLGYSQCTPDASRTTPGYYTSAGEGKMPDAKIGVAYSETITIVMFATYLTQNIDSVILKSVDNIPDGMTYTPLSNKILGGGTSCILVEGTPTNKTQVGSVKIDLQVDLHGGPGGAVKLPYTADLDLKILDADPATTSIQEVTNKEFGAKLAPNPFYPRTSIEVSGFSSKKITMEVFNLVGEKVFANNHIVLNNSNSFEFDGSDLPSGIYVYQINDGEHTTTSRMMISEH